MKKILITGGSGFIGSNLIQKLLDNDYHVVALIREGSVSKLSNEYFKHTNLIIIKGNYYDKHFLKIISGKLFDAIFHFAAIRGSGSGSWQDYQLVNVDGTERLLEYAVNNNVKKFIYCSSVGVLGTIPEYLPAKPDSRCKADGYYHKSKYLAEKLVLSINTKSMKVIVLRPTITYGTNDYGFIYKMITLISKGIFVIPDKPVKIHLLSVKALTQLCLNILNNTLTNRKIYHIADKDPVLLSDVAKSLKKQINSGKYYKLPTFFFKIVSNILQILQEQRIKTSIQLLSENWFYDISDTISDLDYQPVDTLDEIKDIII